MRNLTSLEPLVKVISDDQIAHIVSQLQARQNSTAPGESSISSAALRTVISNVEATPSIAQVLGQKLLPSYYENHNQSIDSMDVLIDLIRRFGSSFTEDQVGNTENSLLEIMRSNIRIVSKRALAATGLLARYLTGPQWNDVCSYISEGFSQDKNWNRTLTLLCSTLVKADPVRFRLFLPSIFNKIYHNLLIDELAEEDDDLQENLDLREAALQTLEGFAQYGETSIDNYIDELIEAVVIFAKFDPNYATADGENGANGDEQEEDYDMEDSDSLDGEDFDLSDNGFSDDEDQSWKLRRHAVKLAAALVSEFASYLPKVYTRLLPLLISRLSLEREEVVRLEIIESISAFINIFPRVSPYSELGGDSDEQLSSNEEENNILIKNSARDVLEDYLSKLITISLKEVTSVSSIQIVHGFLGKILHDLVGSSAFRQHSSELNSIIPVIDTLCKSKSFLMSDILSLVDAILEYHTSNIGPHLVALTDIIIHGMNDHYYKTSCQALTVSLRLFPLYENDAIETILAERVEDTIISKVTTTNLDTETRETALKSLGKFIYYSSLSRGDFERGCNTILDMLYNESLRLVSIGAIKDVAYSLSGNPSSLWLSQSIEKCCALLRMSSRTLRLASLDALLALTSRLDLIGPAQNGAIELLTKDVLAHGFELLKTGDEQSLSLVVSILSKLGPTDPDILLFALEVVGQETIYPSAEKAILNLFKNVIVSNNKANCHTLYEKLSQPLQWEQLQAKIVAYIIVFGDMTEKLHDYEILIQQNPEENLQWPLRVYGNVGKLEKLSSSLDFLYDRLYTIKDENVRLIFADTIGSIASNNIYAYLPLLMEKLRTDTNNMALNLTAIREVVMNEKDLTFDLQNQLWGLLFEVAQHVNDDGERSIVAECVGRLSILSPQYFLPQLQQLLISDKSSVRETVVSAVKYSFGESHQYYEHLLRPIVADFLALVEDEELKIRQVALNALESAIHNKSHLLIPHLSRLLPLLFKETVVNTNLIKTVQMGPFKHKVDEGLDLRKTAFETIYTLISTLPPKLLQTYGMLGVLFDRVIAGLSDDHDIRVLSCVIIGRLASVDFGVISTSANLNQVISKFSGLIGATVKENAIKQEFEKHSEIVRNVQRASANIDKVLHLRISTGAHTGLSDVELAKWGTFYRALEQNKSRS